MATTVLIIDDEQDLVDSIRARLEHEGFRTVSASNGATGYRAAVAANPDIVLLDIMMPTLDGLATCRMLRRGTETRNVPVIMLTALNQRKDVLAAVTAGANDYILKPVDFRTLVSKILKFSSPAARSAVASATRGVA